MKIDIDASINNKLGLRVDRIVRSILARVPERDVIGYRYDVKGVYKGRNQGEKNPRVIIFPLVIFKGWPGQLYRFIPFVSTLMIAKTLCHEIAHHRQAMLHNTSRREAEHQADEYSKQLIRKKYRASLLFLAVILSPCLLLRLLLIKIRKWQF
jgi:hypothetical protein